ncbi:MAG: aminopeptidase P family protein, partial [Spirochaetales bacterium]
MQLRERIAALRIQMATSSIDAYIVPSTDPHQSEYPPQRWKSRGWISGFNGSAGTVVVTAERAGLWTDSRYFLIAEKALAGSPVELFRMDEPGVPTYEEWLGAELPQDSVVAFDSMCMSLSTARSVEQALKTHSIHVKAGGDLFEAIWADRPDLPLKPICAHDDRFAGKSRGEKLSAIREKMESLGVTHHLISTLDDIAWLLNIRGSDVEYSPVAVAHFILSLQSAELFIASAQVPDDLKHHLELDGVVIRPYEEMSAAVASIPEGATALVSPLQISVGFTDALNPGVKAVQRPNLTTGAKARKNAVELEHLRAAMVRDGVAMVRFLHWVTT